MIDVRRVVAAWAMILALGGVAAAQTDAHGHAAEAAPAILAPGDAVSEFSAPAVDGTPRQITFSKTAPSVVMFFSSGCPVCRKMIPIWNEQLAKKPKNLNVVGVIVDREPPDFFTMIPVSFPVVRGSRELMERFKVARVPLTIRVKPGGVVESAAIGVLDPIKLGEMFRP